MNEILFRGKNVSDGKWVYGYYVCATDHWHQHGKHKDWIISRAFQNGGYFNVANRYPVTNVCRYTGLEDKNGKKIFEGDIVDICLLYGVAKMIFRGEVQYKKGFVIKPINKIFLYRNYIPFCETLIYESYIVGNIYESGAL